MRRAGYTAVATGQPAEADILRRHMYCSAGYTGHKPGPADTEVDQQAAGGTPSAESTVDSAAGSGAAGSVAAFHSVAPLRHRHDLLRRR